MSDILRTFAKNSQAMKRTLLLFVVLVFVVSGLRAQHFEWAKGYSSSQEGNRIVGQVTDSLGNLYILGQFRNTAAWDGGSHLLPMAPYGPYNDVTNVLIAKITPDGEMAWKKVIHANNGSQSLALDIKPVGDTAFACLVSFELPYEGSNYCYYLDTLLTTTSDYPTPHAPMTFTRRVALITFDFDGDVMEQHFLTLTYLDSNGNDIMRESFPDRYMNTAESINISFDIDADGNVFLCRQANDYVADLVGRYNTYDGTISGIKYWVDGRVVGQSEVRNSPLTWYPQLLKFSPHMDSLLASRYLVQQCDTNIHYQTNNLYLRLDYNNKPYVVGTLNQLGYYYYNKIEFDSVNNIFFSITSSNPWKGYLVKLDNNLQVTQCVSMEDSIVNLDRQYSFLTFHDLTFDSNLVFISATTSRGFYNDTTMFYSILFCQGVPLTNLRNDGFIMVFRTEQDSMRFVSYMHPLGKMGSGFMSPYCHGNIVCNNNRIMAQPFYFGGIRSSSENITFPNLYDVSLGLSIFDYQGNLVEGIHYAAMSPQNQSGPIALRDSILYLSNYLVSDATFGDIHVPAQGYNACIAKYVDTAFMTPYVYTGDTGNVRIVVAEGGTWTSYPNPFRQRVNIEVENGELKVERAWLTDLAGRREEVRLQPDGPNRYVLDLTGRPQASYLLTLVTADGQQRTLRLLKQSDMFGE